MRESTGSCIAVIPVHNEAATIGALVTEVQAFLPVIVVDDASHDASAHLAAAAGAMVLRQARRGGKGAALRYGFAEAMRQGAESIMTLDGDGQHSPQDIPCLLAARQHWPESLIIGGRLEAEASIPRHRLQAIQVGSFWINWVGRCNVRDTQSGFRVYPAGLLQALTLKHGGFLLESEVLIKASQAGYDLREVPIRTIYPAHRKSHYRPLWDGLLVALYLLYHGLRSWTRHVSTHVVRSRSHTDKPDRPSGHAIRVVAAATGLLPVLVLTMVLQCFLSYLGYDVLSPLIRRFYDQRLLRHPAASREMLHDQPRHNRWEFI